ncbi:MAG: PilZ domain-containing protein [Gammaproteobacteria bacterium]|nr:PilZ domain-containing protein [Gammaproteobacteria bacterium]MDH3768872.1 PilZ domain-containing protein [Gammaproteobacteria bacterium]
MRYKFQTPSLMLAAALLLILAPVIHAGGGTAAITMNSMTVDTTTAGEATITVNITNDGSGRIKVDLNVIALGDCAGDVFTCDIYDCSRSGVGSIDGVNLDAGMSEDYSITLPLDAGDYVFRSRISGTKGGSEDQKWGVQSATVL